MERIYLDSDVFIYFIEQRAPWYLLLHSRLTTTPVQIVVSDLSRMECRVKPMSTGNTVLLAAFDASFAGVELTPLTTAVFDVATVIRATHKFKTPDSIHLAAAVEAKCDVFLTHDDQLKAYTGINVEVI